MKGILRSVDDLGRIVVPKEIRKRLDWKEGTAIDITVNNNQVILEKYSPKICKECKRVVDKTDKFCRYCGREQ